MALKAAKRGDVVVINADDVKGNDILRSLARNHGGVEVDFTCKNCGRDIVNNTERYSGPNKPCRCDKPTVLMKIVPWVY